MRALEQRAGDDAVRAARLAFAALASAADPRGLNITSWLFSKSSETAKQSRKTLLDVLERYVEGNMALFDAIKSVKRVFKHSK